MKFTKTVVQTATENKEENCWEIVMTTTITRVLDDAEPETTEFSVKTYDTNLERGVQVLNHATSEHFQSGNFALKTEVT